MTAFELTTNCKVNLLTPLGRGATGIVYLGKYDKDDDDDDVDGKPNKTDVAVKCLRYADKHFSRSNCHKKRKMGLKEISILKILGNHHPNIVEFYDHKDDGNAFWIIMEYCNLGTLSDYMTQYQPDLRTKQQIMKECSEAIVYMHSLNLLHYDIKPSNILLNEENGKHVVKIADFGGSGMLGTKVFMAPELLKKGKDGLDRKSSDVFSLGLVFYVVLRYSDDHPHFVPVTNKMKENSFGKEMLNAAEKGLPPPELFDDTNQPPDMITAKIQGAIIYMTQYMPYHRMDITNVLTHLKSAESEYRRTDGEETKVERELDSSADQRSSDRQISDSDIGESNDNKQIEKSCNSAISYVANMIAAIQNAQQSPSDLNLRVFADKLKSISENALLELQVACDIVNKRLIGIDIQIQPLYEERRTVQRDCKIKKKCLAETREKHEKARKRICELKDGFLAFFRDVSLEERVAGECKSQIKLIKNELKTFNIKMQRFDDQIKTTKTKFKDECDTLFLMNVFCNYLTIVAKTLEKFRAKPCNDIHPIISPLQDLVYFISSDEFHTCAVSLKMENDIKNLQTLVNESSLSRETQQLQKQERLLEYLVQVRGTFLLRRLLQKQVLDTWGHELELLLQDTSAGVIVKSGPGKEQIHKFKEHINKINLSVEETIKLNSRNVTSFDITLILKLLKVCEISGIEVTKDDLQKDLQYHLGTCILLANDHTRLVCCICVVIQFINHIHNKTHMNLSKREIEKRVDYLSNELAGLMNYVGISEEEMIKYKHTELVFNDPHMEARRQVIAATRNLQSGQRCLQEPEQSHKIAMDAGDASQVNFAYRHPYLQDNKGLLERDLDVTGGLLLYLFRLRVISDDQYKKLLAQAGEGDERKLLLHCVDITLMEDPGMIQYFIRALHRSGDSTNSALAASLNLWCRDNE